MDTGGNGILYGDYILGPTKFLMWDPCFCLILDPVDHSSYGETANIKGFYKGCHDDALKYILSRVSHSGMIPAAEDSRMRLRAQSP